MIGRFEEPITIRCHLPAVNSLQHLHIAFRAELLKSSVSSADTWKPFLAFVLPVIQTETDGLGHIFELDRFRITSEDPGPDLHADG